MTSIIIDDKTIPETPRPSAWGLEDLQRQISKPMAKGSIEIKNLTAKLNEFI
jgi:hypothetical protein